MREAVHISHMPVRAALPADAPFIAAIYNDGIRTRNATFETEERTAQDLAPWFEDQPGVRYPCLVETDNAGVIRGWIRASSYRARACYAGIGDFSVYVAATARRQGVGDALMRAFLPACTDAGLWKLVSRIFPENTASLALCARHDFRVVGTYEAHGQLEGQWRDVVIVEHLLPAAGR